MNLAPCCGLDVHKDSIDIAVTDKPRDAEIRHIGSIHGDVASLDKSLRKLVGRGQPTALRLRGRDLRLRHLATPNRTGAALRGGRVLVNPAGVRRLGQD